MILHLTRLVWRMTPYLIDVVSGRILGCEFESHQYKFYGLVALSVEDELEDQGMKVKTYTINFVSTTFVALWGARVRIESLIYTKDFIGL